MYKKVDMQLQNSRKKIEVSPRFLKEAKQFSFNGIPLPTVRFKKQTKRILTVYKPKIVIRQDEAQQILDQNVSNQRGQFSSHSQFKPTQSNKLLGTLQKHHRMYTPQITPVQQSPMTSFHLSKGMKKPVQNNLIQIKTLKLTDRFQEDYKKLQFPPQYKIDRKRLNSYQYLYKQEQDEEDLEFLKHKVKLNNYFSQQQPKVQSSEQVSFIRVDLPSLAYENTKDNSLRNFNIIV